MTSGLGSFGDDEYCPRAPSCLPRRLRARIAELEAELRTTGTPGKVQPIDASGLGSIEEHAAAIISAIRALQRPARAAEPPMVARAEEIAPEAPQTAEKPIQSGLRAGQRRMLQTLARCGGELTKQQSGDPGGCQPRQRNVFGLLVRARAGRLRRRCRAFGPNARRRRHCNRRKRTKGTAGDVGDREQVLRKAVRRRDDSLQAYRNRSGGPSRGTWHRILLFKNPAGDVIVWDHNLNAYEIDKTGRVLSKALLERL